MEPDPSRGALGGHRELRTAVSRYAKARIYWTTSGWRGCRKDWSSCVLESLRLIPATNDDGWGLEVGCDIDGIGERVALEGPIARQVVGKLIPRLTPDGGNREQVARAVRRIEQQGDPTNYLKWLARNAKSVREWSLLTRRDVVTGEKRTNGTRVDTLGVQGLESLLAVEMAVNEENERRALEGELGLLERAWKDAAEIAAIADNLTLPQHVETELRNLQRKKDTR